MIPFGIILGNGVYDDSNAYHSLRISPHEIRGLYSSQNRVGTL